MSHEASPDRPLGEEVVVFGCALTYSTGLMMGLLLIPFYGEHLEFSALTVGLLVGVAGFFLTLLRIPAGFLVDRFGSRGVAVAGTALQLASAPFLLLVHSDWISPVLALALAQVLAGSSRAAFWPAKQAYLVDWPQKTATYRFGRLSAADSGAQIAGPALIGVIASAFGLLAASASFLVMSTVAVGLAAMLPRVTDLSQRRAQSADAEESAGSAAFATSFKVVASSRPVYIGAMAAFAAGIPMILFGSFAPLFLFELGFGATAVGLLISIRGLSMVLFSAIYGRLFAGGDYRSPWAWSMISLAIGFGAMPFLATEVPLAGAIAVIGLGAGVVQVLSMVVVGDLAPRGHVGLAMAYSGLFRSISVFITPLLLGVAVELLGMGAAFWLPAMAFAVGALASGAIGALARRDKR